MTAPASTRTHADAVVALLTGAGVVAYLSVSPSSAPDHYTVVHPSPGEVGGAVGDRFQELWVPFQTTCVGTTPGQALWQHDTTALVLHGGEPSLAGRTVHPIWLDQQPQPVLRDDTLAAPLYYATARWVFHTSV